MVAVKLTKMSEIRNFTLTGANGFRAEISTYGAKILRLLVPDTNGTLADVVLGFNTLREWQTKETYFNAIIGRVANRIKNGRFELDGKIFQLPINNGTNALHGGVHGFNEKVWDVISHNDHELVLQYHAADGEENYPGNLLVTITYAVKDTALSIRYQAVTDAPTIVNLTNHSYFNLNGESSPSIRNHELQVFADAYTPFDETACPTGEILPVEGTPMDFRVPTLIGERIDDPFFVPGRGIDNNFVLRKIEGNNSPELAAIVRASGRKMEVYTTLPGLQVYTGNYVEENVGKGGTCYKPQNAVCLETQYFPDAPNHPSFPSIVLRPGEEYCHTTVFSF